MIFLYFRAPFGAFKPFQSVEMLSTAEFITYSAAYGLLLGLAGIDSRNPQVKKQYSAARIALGTMCLPRKGRAFQQLHKYKDKKEIPRAKGRKPFIDTYWREFLYDRLEGYIGLEHPELESLVRQGIEEPATLNYWGLPFMGDNNYFIERLDIVETPRQCQWFHQFTQGDEVSGERLFYLSAWTDYQDSTRSKSSLFCLKQQSPRDARTAWVCLQDYVST
jgi:CRISPR-associated protein Cas5t